MYIQPDYRALLQLLPFSFKSEKAMLGYEVLKYIKAFRNTMHISYEPLETVWNGKVCLIPLLFFYCYSVKRISTFPESYMEHQLLVM